MPYLDAKLIQIMNYVHVKSYTENAKELVKPIFDILYIQCLNFSLMFPI